MFSASLVTKATVLVALAATAASIPVAQDDTKRACYKEPLELHCYNGADDEPQDVTLADVTYVASYLRSYGRETRAGRQFVMKAADTPDCAEWPLYTRNTVAAYAKHVNNAVDTSVLFEDIANTIDGGLASPKKASLMDCLTAGGSFAVQYNASNPQYATAAYKTAGYTPAGILIKIVASI